MQFFSTCKNLDEVKQLYRELAKQFHPDRGGDLVTMQKINAEYSLAIAKISKGQNLSSEETENEILQAEKYREALEKIIHLEKINIEVVGRWIWVTGDTYPVKTTIKEAGFLFASKKVAWYFRTDENKCSGGKKTLDEIRAKYGSQTVTGQSFTKRNFLK